MSFRIFWYPCTIRRWEDRRAEGECKDLQEWAWVEAQGD